MVAQLTFIFSMKPVVEVVKITGQNNDFCVIVSTKDSIIGIIFSTQVGHLYLHG